MAMKKKAKKVAGKKKKPAKKVAKKSKKQVAKSKTKKKPAKKKQPAKKKVAKKAKGKAQKAAPKAKKKAKGKASKKAPRKPALRAVPDTLNSSETSFVDTVSEVPTVSPVSSGIAGFGAGASFFGTSPEDDEE